MLQDIGAGNLEMSVQICYENEIIQLTDELIQRLNKLYGIVIYQT